MNKYKDWEVDAVHVYTSALVSTHTTLLNSKIMINEIKN